VFGVGFLFGEQWFALPLGVLLGVLAAILIFGRRVQRNVFAKAEGQPGAAAWALENLRGGWKVTPAVAGTTQLDAVHRVIGRPGVVLVAEGAAHRLKPLLAQEKKRVSRLIGDTPIYDVTVGNGEGQVPLAKLPRHLAKLPRNITAAQIDGLESKLAILSTRAAAIPKGPLPQRPTRHAPPLTLSSADLFLSVVSGCGARWCLLHGRADRGRRCCRPPGG
jgi:hypothetical protein